MMHVLLVRLSHLGHALLKAEDEWSLPVLVLCYSFSRIVNVA